MTQDRIVAVGLLTQRDVDVLGTNFRHLWPIDEAPCFSQLLEAIDEADRDLWRERDASRKAQRQL
jgi:hypothetical protein